jgi:hypothetical protein
MCMTMISSRECLSPPLPPTARTMVPGRQADHDSALIRNIVNPCGRGGGSVPSLQMATRCGTWRLPRLSSLDSRQSEERPPAGHKLPAARAPAISGPGADALLCATGPVRRSARCKSVLLNVIPHKGGRGTRNNAILRRDAIKSYLAPACAGDAAMMGEPGNRSTLPPRRLRSNRSGKWRLGAGLATPTSAYQQ